jgi:hypothetical protein
MKKRVIIESPFAGNVARNKLYARECLLHALKLGEAPFASHLLYTQVLEDLSPEERKMGIEAGFAWGAVADYVAVYVDLGVSEGMQMGVTRALERGLPVEYRFRIEGEFACSVVLPDQFAHPPTS